MSMRTSAKVVLLALGVVALGAVTAQAQPRLNTGNAENGRKIAERLCTTCHSLAARPASATTSTDVMSFPAIAAQPTVSSEYLAGRIIIPHPAMPDTSLNIAEIRDVIAYIMSLKPAAK